MRTDVVGAAVEATKAQRYVPYAVCLTCVRHVFPEDHKRAYPDHRTVALTLGERDEVARIHKAAADAEFAAYAARFRRT